MQRSGRMQPILDLNENEVNRLAREWGKLQKKMIALDIQLTELRHYRDEYVNEFNSISTSGCATNKLLNYLAFLDQLDGAIRHNEQALDRLQATCEQARQDWLNSRSRNLALGQVVQKFKREEDQVRNRHEQKSLDDLAIQQVLRRQEI